MKKRTFVCVLISLVVLTVPAAAGVVVFDNYPISGAINSWLISSFGSDTYSVSDSFTLSSGATVNAVNFGLWVGSERTELEDATVDWSIQTAAGNGSPGNTDHSGTASLTGTAIGLDGIGFEAEVFKASFSFTPFHLDAGTTYFLTLQNYSDTNQDLAYWDENDGPSSLTVYSNQLGRIFEPVPDPNHLGCGASGAGTGTCSESFQILGTPDGGGTTPEPSTLALLGSGILAAFALRRKAIHR